jgi:hypothetical protein
MIITDTLEVRLPTLLAADASTLAPAALALAVSLVTAPFTPGRNTRYADLTKAAGAGLEPKAPAVGAQTMGFDPSKNAWKVILKEPAGGWNWVSTGVETPAETVEGYVVSNNDNSQTYGSDVLPNGPVTVAAVGVVVSVGEIVVWIPAGLITGDQPSELE